MDHRHKVVIIRGVECQTGRVIQQAAAYAGGAVEEGQFEEFGKLWRQLKGGAVWEVFIELRATDQY